MATITPKARDQIGTETNGLEVGGRLQAHEPLGFCFNPFLLPSWIPENFVLKASMKKHRMVDEICAAVRVQITIIDLGSIYCTREEHTCLIHAHKKSICCGVVVTPPSPVPTSVLLPATKTSTPLACIRTFCFQINDGHFCVPRYRGRRWSLRTELSSRGFRLAPRSRLPARCSLLRCPTTTLSHATRLTVWR